MIQLGTTFTIGAFCSLVALALSFVSATSYAYIFAIILVFDAIAGGCVLYLFLRGGNWRVASTVLGLVVVYTVCDIGFRIFMGVRVLDLFR